MGSLFTPHAVEKGTLQLPGSQGSALWQGASWDPDTNMLYVPSVTNMSLWKLVVGGTRSEMSYIVADPLGGSADEDGGPRVGGAGRAGAAAGGGGRLGGAPVLGPGVTVGPWCLGPQGLPLLKPPYGRIAAYNMNTGDLQFQIANGGTYEWMKTHPALQGLAIPRTGRGDEALALP